MPNWNDANLTITGTKENIDRIAETGFDFQKLRPMPQEMYEDSKGKNLGGRCWKKDDKTGTLEEWQTHCKTDKEKATMKEHYEEHLVDFAKVCGWIDKYGYNGWYDWSVDHWGTKWNPYPDSVEVNRVSDTELDVSLTTAWSLPLDLLKFLMKKYNVSINGETMGEDDRKHREFAL